MGLPSVRHQRSFLLPRLQLVRAACAFAVSDLAPVAFVEVGDVGVLVWTRAGQWRPNLPFVIVLHPRRRPCMTHRFCDGPSALAAARGVQPMLSAWKTPAKICSLT